MKYKIELEVVSPVHVGSGASISSIEYLIEDKFYRVDMDRIFEDERFDTDEFIKGAKRGALYLGEFAPELAKEHVRYVLDISDSTRKNLQGLIDSRSSEVREFIKTKDKVYIPGSSIKGAIRTAILWWVLDKDKALFEKARRYLKVLLNAAYLSNRIRDARSLEEIKREINRSRGLKGDPNVYINLLKELTEDYIGEIKRKIGELSRIRKEHVGDRIEKFVFGKDPTHDILKALQISDTNTVDTVRLGIEEVRTLTTTSQGHNWKRYYTFVEALKPGTKLDLEMKIDEFLLEREFNNKKNLVREIPKMCSEFSDDFIENEIRFLEKYNDPRELDEVLEFYKSLKRQKSGESFLIHLAWGSGWHGITVGRLLEPILLGDLRRKFKLGKAGVAEFPKTRRLVFENGRPKYPLGWVKMKIKGSD